jgi:hypothetical protein
MEGILGEAKRRFVRLDLSMRKHAGVRTRRVIARGKEATSVYN